MNSYLIPEKIEYALGWMVIHSIWQGLAIAILWGIALVILQKKSAQLRYLLANLALFSILVCAVITFDIYYQKPSKQLNIQSINGKIVTNIKPTNEVSISEKPLMASTSETNAEFGQKRFSMNNLKEYFNEYLPLIVMAWLLGMVAFLLRLLGNVSYVYYLKRRINFPADEYWITMLDDLVKRTGLAKGIALVESAMVRTPQLIGYLKPMILFPLGMINRMSAAEVEAVLAHEIAHILRRDYLFNIVQSVIEAIFYYHPATWWLSGQIRDERESACDEVAIAMINGNTMNYAKALVTVQEMAHFPMSSALAFAGQARKSQLMNRLQKILNINQNKSNAMEKTIAACLIGLTVLGLVYGQNTQTSGFKNTKMPTNSLSIESQNNDEDPKLGTKGFWNAVIEKNEVQVQFNSRNNGNSWNMNEQFKKTEFSNFPSQDTDFKLVRESGTITFQGKFDGNEGYGKFSFEPSEAFKTYLNTQNIVGVSDADLLFCFMNNMDKTYLETLNKAGYKDLKGNKLRELAIFKVTPQNLETFVPLLEKESGSQPKIQDIIDLKIHGIDEDFIQSMKNGGFQNLNAQKLIEAKIHGIDGDFIKEIQQNIKGKIDIDKAIEMKIHGIDGDFSNKMKDLNGQEMNVEELVNAKIHGLDKMDLKKIKELGYKDLNTEDLQSFSIHGIDANFIESMNKAGLGKLSNDELLSAKIQGLNADYIKGVIDAGLKNLSFDDIMSFKIQGISLDFMKSYADVGFKNLDADDYVNFKIHGISANFAKSLKDIFKNITKDDLVNAKIHGISADYIKKMKEKGYQLPTIDDYINLKIQGFTRSNLDKNRPEGFHFDNNNDFSLKSEQDNLDKMMKKLNKEQAELKAQEQKLKLNYLPKLNKNLDDLNEKLNSNKLVEKLIRAMHAEGLIKVGDKNQFKMTENSLVVNGKKIDNEAFEGYKKIAQKETRNRINSGTRIEFDGYVSKLSPQELVTSGRTQVTIED